MSRLHKISSCEDPARKADVVFIHGLGGDAFGTWSYGPGEDTSWPHWLGSDFPDVGVWSLDYAASPTRWTGLPRLFGRGPRAAGHSMSLPDRATQVLDLLVQKGIGVRPLMFVGHSLGGLLAKQILRKANDSSVPAGRSVAQRTRAVLFLATPHSGAELASLLDKFRAVFNTTVSIEDLREHDAHLADLYEWYRNHSPTLGIQTVTYYESVTVRGVMAIVNRTSSHPGVGRSPVPLEEDHISIAKPRERDAQVFVAARDLLTDYVLARPSQPIAQRMSESGTGEAHSAGPNLFAEAIAALVPHVQDQTHREPLFQVAFGPGHALLSQIELGGDKDTFAHNAMSKLNAYGWLDGERHAIVALLEAVQAQVGSPHAAAITDLIRRYNTRNPSPRQRELDYMDWLETLCELDRLRYVPLKGVARSEAVARGLRRGAANPFAKNRRLALHTPSRQDAQEAMPEEPQEFDDILSAIAELHRVIVVGEPGAGKTWTLLAVASDAIAQAREDPASPIPVLVRLGLWTGYEALNDFITGQMGGFGGELARLRGEDRVAFLLDGLNEMPLDRRAAKATDVRDLINLVPPGSTVAVSCRQLDYDADKDLALPLSRLDVQPLSPSAIRRVIDAELSAVTREAEDLFWRLAGGDVVRAGWNACRTIDGDLTEDEFFDTAGMNDRLHGSMPWDARQARDRLLADGRSLFRLARNPFMLSVLCLVYKTTGDLPPNRGRLLAELVINLMDREHLTVIDEDGELVRDADSMVLFTQEGDGVLDVLSDLAWYLQAGGAEGESRHAILSILMSEALNRWGESAVYRARSASLVSVSGDYIRFTHHLIQEYFAARALRTRIAADAVAFPATNLWPSDKWWQPTNWEEAVILLAGLYPNDCTPVVQWLEVANPEVAARCIMESGAATPDATRRRMRQLWMPRLTDLDAEPMPAARAAIGRAVAMANLTDGGPMLDDRPGVGLRRDGLPDVLGTMCPVAPGTVVIEGGVGERVVDQGFRMARYPVTHIQYRAFVEAADGYQDRRWWDEPVKLADRQDEPGKQAWPIGNHPAESVSWYDAMAFCRWLTARLRATGDIDVDSDLEIRLPTEAEWQLAAAGREGRMYPWGAKYEVGRANVDESREEGGTYLQRTTAVGIYPHGAAVHGSSVDQTGTTARSESDRELEGRILDLSGNVWEWTLSNHSGEDRVDGLPSDLTNDRPRVVRGGSWILIPSFARAARRDYWFPVGRNRNYGFRVVLAAPVS